MPKLGIQSSGIFFEMFLLISYLFVVTCGHVNLVKSLVFCMYLSYVAEIAPAIFAPPKSPRRFRPAEIAPNLSRFRPAVFAPRRFRPSL